MIPVDPRPLMHSLLVKNDDVCPSIQVLSMPSGDVVSQRVLEMILSNHKCMIATAKVESGLILYKICNQNQVFHL